MIYYKAHIVYVLKPGISFPDICGTEFADRPAELADIGVRALGVLSEGRCVPLSLAEVGELRHKYIGARQAVKAILFHRSGCPMPYNATCTCGVEPFYAFATRVRRGEIHPDGSVVRPTDHHDPGDEDRA